MFSFLPYIILGLVAVGVGIALGFRKNKKLSEDNSQLPLKQTWIPIEIDFDNCEIKSNEYYEEQQSESFPTRIEMLDSLSSSSSSNRVKRNVCVVLYKLNAMTYRSDPVYLSEDHLRIYLAEKKTSYIYLNPNALCY